MDRSQAEAVVALVQAYFPRPELPGSTVMAWATELEPFDFDDGQEAARRLSRGYHYPVLAELIGLVDEVRRQRVDAETPLALPASEAEIVEAMPEDVRQKWHALQAKWAGETDRSSEEEDAEWQRVKTATLARLRMHGTCLGTDKPPVEVEGGMFVCPVCRVEVVDPRKAARA